MFHAPDWLRKPVKLFQVFSHFILKSLRQYRDKSQSEYAELQRDHSSHVSASAMDDVTHTYLHAYTLPKKTSKGIPYANK